nr:MAG TPA: hypothetical protein [Caudoviricetes sp.]
MRRVSLLLKEKISSGKKKKKRKDRKKKGKNNFKKIWQRPLQGMIHKTG